MATNTEKMKKELAAKTNEMTEGKETKLKKSMSIADLIKAMEPEIKKALPEVITPERFTRMALSALNTTPKLQECTQMSFLSALMNAAQLGLEPNTPLGQAYLIPFNNKGTMECQFQLGYKGLIDLCYRNPQMQMISAQAVYENDYFEYELGLSPVLVHRPSLNDRGEIKCFYGLFKLTNGGFGFEVMSKTDIDAYAKEYSKSFDSSFSPWKTNYDGMARKTVIKQALKYAPLKTDFRKALSTDETIKTELSEDMSAIQGENIFDAVYREDAA
ncbi:recombinase RecT [Faecalicatena contorta]|uniref:recombinase RecT n=1 Tax=Faecalicatena contorta TaxID=39482 RepID=UPI001F433A73|nr:recombinase RecT [Faecalicatena contorta]MCF2554388.1 recombinase RecT [Faecalicatena contorta]